MERPKLRAILEPPDGRARDYSSLIREANSFNGRLLAERAGRLPFLDNQTGIAQGDCNLWRREQDRVRCQAHKPSGWNDESRLYSYPNQVRLSRNRPQLAGATQTRPNCVSLAPASSVAPSASYSDLDIAHKERVGPTPVRANAFTNATSTTMNHHRGDQQRPPRADSTGSHSFADSDSRDHLSTGTSQSVESPRSQLLDDEQPLSHLNACYLALGTEVKSGQTAKGHSPHEHEDCELSTSIESDHSYRVMEKRSKLSKGRNVGSSLIKSVERSLLIKSDQAKRTNGRKAIQNARGGIVNSLDKSSSSTQKKSPSSGPKQTTREAQRPYVCPICDQTYKTRPGLSYHFIHSHDTVLPRNLPVKINPGKPETTKSNKQIKTGSKIGQSQAKTKTRPARTRTRQQEEPTTTTTRVLRRCRKVAKQEDDVQMETPPDEQAALEQIPARSPGESTIVQEDGPEETSQLDLKFQEADELQATDEAKLGASHCVADSEDGGVGGGDDDDDDETVIEMSLDQTNPTKEILNSETLSANQDESSKEWHHENDKEINHDDGPQEDLQPSDTVRTDPPKEQSKVTNRRNIFCDFCLGTVDKNRRTCLPEELISCSNCGSSGHPSCLRFSENICRSVKKYSWQCLECKTCSTCNQADHEDQMLFCDDCDRSYHTYCLSPRLEHPPEGSWTCRECLDEYYNDGGK